MGFRKRSWVPNHYGNSYLGSLRFRSSPLRAFPRDTKILRIWPFYFVRDFRRDYLDFGLLGDAAVLGRDRCIRRRHHGRRRYRSTWDAGLSITQ